MGRISVLISILIGAGLFIYGISSFLVATLDISEWKGEQRFLTALIYWIAVRPVRHALMEPTLYSIFKKKREEIEIKVVEPERQLQEA